jgi:hypothetical protein
MESMRSFIYVILLTGIASTGIQAQSLYVKEKAGTLTTYSLNHIRKLTFPQGKLNISQTIGNADEYMLEGIRFLTFSDVIIGIDNHDRVEMRSLFRIFPNPVKEFLAISALPHGDLDGLVEVAGLNGEVLKSLDASHVSELKIDIRDLSDGIYLCRYINGIGWHTEKFLKTH